MSSRCEWGDPNMCFRSSLATRPSGTPPAPIGEGAVVQVSTGADTGTRRDAPRNSPLLSHPGALGVTPETGLEARKKNIHRHRGGRPELDRTQNACERVGQRKQWRAVHALPAATSAGRTCTSNVICESTHCKEAGGEAALPKLEAGTC
eukprot:360672-Chlamydomonas_euryale.AAC.10